METIEESIEVRAPLQQVYNQWTQFEDFPQFMDGVKSVRQLDDKRLHWVAEIAGKTKEWDAEIYDQVPDQRIAWKSISGVANDGIVTFFPIDADTTRVVLRIDYETEGTIESLGDALGVVSSKVEGDLKRFKTFIEARGQETGAWRGEIHGNRVAGSASSDYNTQPRSKRLHS
jgi:uncharacterized membrane protein